jgi:methionine aminotransferase
MTLLEKKVYLDPPKNVLNFTYGYPEDLNPDWIRNCQLFPPDDFLNVPPATYVNAIKNHFREFFSSDNIKLTPTCSLAIVIALTALVRSASDEVIMLDPNFDGYLPILQSQGAKAVFAQRNPDNSINLDNIRKKCTARTKAIILCNPENPLGIVYPRKSIEEIIAFCKQKKLTLIVDCCLAQASPFDNEVPIVSRLECGNDLSYILFGDTGKILGLNGSKFGALVYSDNWAEPLETAQSAFFFQYSQYDLYLLATILSDRRFPAYMKRMNRQIARNYEYLKTNLDRRLRLLNMDGGCFCVIDIQALGIGDVSYVDLLIERHAAVLVPMSYFYADSKKPPAQVRVSLTRSMRDIKRLAAIMNRSAGERS